MIRGIVMAACFSGIVFGAYMVLMDDMVGMSVIAGCAYAGGLIQGSWK